MIVLEPTPLQHTFKLWACELRRLYPKRCIHLQYPWLVAIPKI